MIRNPAAAFLLVSSVFMSSVFVGCDGRSSPESGPSPESGLPGFDPDAFARLDLAASLNMAEISRETGFLDFGAPETLKHLLEGWDRHDVWGEEKTFIWSLGMESALELVLLERRTYEVEVRLKPFTWEGAPPQTVTIELNGKAVGELQLQAHAAEYRFELSADHVQPGRNRLRFRYAYAEAPRRVLPGPADRRLLAVAWDYLRVGSAPRAAGPGPEPQLREEGLSLPTGSEVSFYLRLAETGYLVFDAVRARDTSGAVLGIRFEGEDEETVKLGPNRKRFSLELGAPGERRLVRISLRVPTRGEPPSGGVLIEGPVLYYQEAPEVVVKPPVRSARSKLPNVIFYLPDTLRADHLGCYGYPRPTSPRIDAFAQDALVFDRPIAHSSWTGSSVASILTGLLPTTHGVFGRDEALPFEAFTIAEILREAGYETAAFVTNQTVSKPFGFAQGFDTFHLFGPERGWIVPYTRAGGVNATVFEFLERRSGEKPLFLYVHTLDPHPPFVPLPESAEKLAGGVEAPPLAADNQSFFNTTAAKYRGPAAAHQRLGSVSWLSFLQRATDYPVAPKLVEDLTALYDAETHANDAEFGVFLDYLRRARLYDSSILVFLSDHGEGFYEHGRWGHSLGLYEELIRVPLIVRFPDEEHEDLLRIGRFPEATPQIDLLPTVLDYLGLPIPEAVEGRSLLPRLSGTAPAKDPVTIYSHLDLEGRFAQSLVYGHYKLHCLAPQWCDLFDLQADPRESVDFTMTRPVLAGYLRTRLRALGMTSRPLTAGEAAMDAETREQLEALGYL